MEKMTYVKALDVALDMFHQGGQVDPEDVIVVEKLEALRAQLVKRQARKPGKMTKAQIANAALADQMVEFVKEHGPVTCADLQEAFDLSNQKVTAILTRSGKFVKIAEAKGKVKAQWNVA